MGFIHWLDGSETKVQIKGSRTNLNFWTPPTQFRESLFYSRITETFSDVIHNPYTYMAVADLDSFDSLFVNEYMVNYTRLKEV